ncbi:YheC/YheD family protein [Paenibacillus sp. NPDC058071]|uniref:YheC/YheD family protein n=1 Tax=Paenibacillus sp. NPDC058071 TaxID=3346326 RepID=UPI0036DADA45
MAAHIRKAPRKRSAANKWRKTVVLTRNGYLNRFVPETRQLTRTSLKTMLDRYGMVYVKPVVGSHGVGVMRVDKLAPKSGYSLHSASGIVNKAAFDSLYHLIVRKSGGKSYLVQRGVHMLRHQGSIFDMRIVAQLNEKRRWQVTGMLARVAKKGKAVTNGAQGAAIRTVATVLRPHAGGSGFTSTANKLQAVCLSSARQLHGAYPFLHELGFDIALDRQLHPWILEVNATPEAIPFAKLPSLTMYRRILRYRRMNTR